MPRMGITEEDWNGLKLEFLKTVQPNSFSKLIPAACNFKNNAEETFVCLVSLILSFACKFFAYFKFHSDWGQVIGKLNKMNWGEMNVKVNAKFWKGKSSHVRESKTVMNSGFQAMDSGFHELDSRFLVSKTWISDSEFGGIPDSLSCNSDSQAQDSGFPCLVRDKRESPSIPPCKQSLLLSSWVSRGKDVLPESLTSSLWRHRTSFLLFCSYLHLQFTRAFRPFVGGGGGGANFGF